MKREYQKEVMKRAWQLYREWVSLGKKRKGKKFNRKAFNKFLMWAHELCKARFDRLRRESAGIIVVRDTTGNTDPFGYTPRGYRSAWA